MRGSFLGLVAAAALLWTSSGCRAATIIIAASNSPESAKRRADVVCDGTNDTAVLAWSLQQGQLRQVEFDDNAYTNAYTGQSVEWLAGDYYLLTPLVLPQVCDTHLEAEGASLYYNVSTGDAVTITGSLRTTFRFGTIWSSSNGAALAAKDRPYTSPFMPNIMSRISWQGLQHVPPDGTTGVGFWAQKHFVVNKISGTDVRGFNIGVWCDATGGGSEGTIDTNWWWLSYVRGCATDIRVDGSDGSVNSQQWSVNVDASLAGSVAVRTSGAFDWWRIIMGDVSRDPSTRSLIVEPSAHHNIFEITPPLHFFDGYENKATNGNNIFAQVPSGNAPPPPGMPHSHLNYQMYPSNDGPAGSSSSGAEESDLRPEVQAHKMTKGGVESSPAEATSTALERQVKSRLEEVRKWHAEGLITEEEFTSLKARLLRKLE